MAADFNKPVLADAYSSVLSFIRDMFASLGKMDGTGANPPTNLIRWSSAGSKFEKYNGSSWGDLAATYAITVTNSTQLGSVAAATYARKDQANEFTGGEVQSSSANAFRLTFGSYGAILRNDGSNFFLAFTNSGDKYGSFNSLRPFSVSLATGAVSINGGTPWTSTNFDPTTKANLSGAAFTGTVSTTLLRVKQSQADYFDIGAGATGVSDPDCFVYNRNNGAILFGTNNTLTLKIRADGVVQQMRGYFHSAGTTGGVFFDDRTTARFWGWYGSGDVVRLWNGSADIVQIDNATGTITATDFTSTSDLRLKDGVTRLRARGRLRPILFTWLNRPECAQRAGEEDIGFGAQDVQKLYPWAVFVDADGILRVSYPKLVAALAAEGARDRFRFWLALAGAYGLAAYALFVRG